MKLHIHCSACDHKYRVDTKHLGRTVKCKACGENMLIRRKNETKPSVVPGSEVRYLTPSNSIPASEQDYHEEVEDESESDGVEYVMVVSLLAIISMLPIIIW